MLKEILKYVAVFVLSPVWLAMNGQPVSAMVNLALLLLSVPLAFALHFHLLLLLPVAHALVAMKIKEELRIRREISEARRLHGPPEGYR